MRFTAWDGYLLVVDGRIRERKGGGTYALAEAWEELRGCASCEVVRNDLGLTSVWRRRGHLDPEVRTPNGWRPARTGLAPHARRRYHREMAEQNRRLRELWEAERGARVAS